MAGGGSRAGKSGSFTAKGAIAYAHAESNELAHDFRSIDARKGRLAGLRNMKALVGHYYSGAAAADWHKAIDKQIAGVHAAKTRNDARNARRRKPRVGATA